MSDTDTTRLDTGGPAFPTVAGQTVYSNGMSLRDYFAGQALAGLLANDSETAFGVLACSAYAAADAMLKARAE